jgi:hypothetical protein
MVVLRAFLALVAGFATMALLVAVMTALLRKITPEWVGTEAKPNPGYVFVNLGYSFLAAAAGGSVTASLAEANPLIHALALAIAVLLLAALSALQQRGQQPTWYLLALVALTPVGVLAGGFIRLRVMGIF